jgi:hypothetical protein
MGNMGFTIICRYQFIKALRGLTSPGILWKHNRSFSLFIVGTWQGSITIVYEGRN